VRPETRANSLLWLGALALLPPAALLVRSLSARYDAAGVADLPFATTGLAFFAVLLGCPALALASGVGTVRQRPGAACCVLLGAILLTTANISSYLLD
jgi:hypothetical protein